MQKGTKNSARGGITTREYNPTFTYCYKIHQYFLQAITNAIQPVTERPCTNCREFPNFILEISCSFQGHPAKDRKISGISSGFHFALLEKFLHLRTKL